MMVRLFFGLAMLLLAFVLIGFVPSVYADAAIARADPLQRDGPYLVSVTRQCLAPPVFYLARASPAIVDGSWLSYEKPPDKLLGRSGVAESVYRSDGDGYDGFNKPHNFHPYLAGVYN